MAADSSVWSSSQGSEIRLPGGDAELGVDQQQQQPQHLKGGGGAEIHGSSSSFEEWYDASLIDEMKELSSYPAQQQRHHQNQQHHHHQLRNSASSPAFAAADRRGFSSTFLDVDESGFMGDFAAAATAGGLLPPPPPPLLPPPPPPRHRFGGGDIGLLDFGGGGAAGGAAAWAGPNFGMGTSLSIGTMSGTVFSSKTTQQHTGSGHSSPSTIIKSPTSAFASADSSLEIGGGGGGGDVEVAAVAATTGRRRRKGGGGGGGGGGSSSSPPAACEEAGLDGREDEDMDDASGLLCETDDMGGQPAPTTGQPGVPGGGKGNRKGLPAKNLMAERRRRKKLNDRLYMLRSVVPRITKMDRASILGDAIEYLKELLQRINELHNELEGPGGDGPLGPSDQHIPPLPGMIPAPPPLLMPPTCIKEESGAAGSAGPPLPPPPPPPPSASEPPKVEVRTRDGKTINIHMFCARRPGLLLSTMRALDGLGLDVQQAVISCFSGFVLDVFRAEQCREGEVAPEDIKSALLHTAGCNNEAMAS